jgi:hypothetical protein
VCFSTHNSTLMDISKAFSTNFPYEPEENSRASLWGLVSTWP